jgi:hypothetical protein
VLQHGDQGASERLEDFLRALLPGLARVRAEPVTVERGNRTDKVALVFHQRLNGSVGLFGPRQMSEGTLRALTILAALY